MNVWSLSAVAPVIRAVESVVTVVVGDTATMTCTASGDPTPVQTWTRNGMDVSGISRFQTSADGSMLTVSESQEEDEGTYTCHATNAANTQTDTVTLNVIGKRARATSLNTITDILPLQFPLPSRPS